MSEPTYGMTYAVGASTTGTEASPAARDSLIIGDGQVSVAEGMVQKIAGKAGRDISGVHLVMEYGVSTADLGRSSQRNVKQSVELMTGLRVVEVNVAVDDVYLPAPGEQATTPSRVS
jgi:uncharacterized alkaline shock family protein YloU